MWQRTAVWMVCISASWAARAEEFNTSWSTPSLPTSLLADDCRLRFEIVSGRIAVRTVYMKTKRRESVERHEGDTRESLSYFLADTSVSLRYESSAPGARLVLEVPHCSDLSLEMNVEREGKHWRIAYCQTEDGVQLAVTSPEGRQQFRHSSLWHLMFEQPEMSRAYLLPLLSLCRSSWPIEQEWNDVRSELFARVDSIALPSHDELMTWVRQLSSPRREDRRAAMKRLRAVGQPIIAFLDSMDEKQLDREQRFYLARLRQALDRPTVDTPQRVAARLVADPRIWTALAYDSDVATRTLAARQRERITGQPAAVEDYASSK